MALDERPLSPAQQEVVGVLGAKLHERPSFDPRLAGELRAELEERLAPLAGLMPEGEVVRVSKHALAGVHGCEAEFLASRDEPFTWSAATARGSVAHKAIELSVHWRGEPAPGELVDEALARLTSEADPFGDWLAQLSEGERAELRGQAVDHVAKFLECFPPLQPRWRPVAESRLRAELCDGRIVLAGKVDLAIGRPEGVVAGKVLVDLKTGGFAPVHLDDLRFYALIETLRLGVPPRLLATHYLDTARLHAEPVTGDVLRSAVERVVRGLEAMAQLRRGEREPVLRPGPRCRWCSLRDGCEDGRRWLDERAERDGW